MAPSSVRKISSISISAGLLLVSLTLLSQVDKTSAASLGPNSDTIRYSNPYAYGKREVTQGRINPAYLGEWTKINSRTEGAAEFGKALGYSKEKISALVNYQYKFSSTDDGADGITKCISWAEVDSESSDDDGYCFTLVPGQTHVEGGVETTLSIDRHGIPKTVYYSNHLTIIDTGAILPNGDLTMIRSVGDVIMTEYFKKTQS